MLDVGRFARQLRLWETLAELNDRARSAHGAERADLLYKVAAVQYHNRHAFYPRYSWGASPYGRALRLNREANAARFSQAIDRWRANSISWRRALAQWAAIRADHPGWAGQDKTTFSMGLAWRRVLDLRMRGRFATAAHPYDERDEAVRNLKACMVACLSEHPKSPLAADAAAAVRYWSTNWPPSGR